jgi:pantetheine-phosphate adenylyltransferase
MKTAIYPGSFNPWHDGHTDILDKALQVFDKVVIAIGQNPDKPTLDLYSAAARIPENIQAYPDIELVTFDGLLINYILENPINTIVRGLRHGKDLEDERLQQYWNEDLAKKSGIYLPPTVYFVADRHLVHVSSTAVRVVDKLKRQRGKICSCPTNNRTPEKICEKHSK